MARMYPEWITETQRSENPKFRAEFKVYDALKTSLSDEWYVFYSRSWTWVERETLRLRTREADFIIAHPDCGIMLMEVKGGGIQVREGKWLSTDRYGNEWEISPYEQVAIATNALERRLSEEQLNPFKGYRFSTAVCFPDIVLSSDLDEHLEIKHKRVTIDAEGIQQFQHRISEIMKGGVGVFDPPGLPRILMLKELIAASWEIYAPRWIQIRDSEDEIKHLTENQFKLLYQIAPTAQRMIVTGCAGSGKTMLAAETARRMVNLHHKRVLFTCYNRNLANWVRTSSFFVDNGQMMAVNFHKLCSDFATAAGLSIPDFWEGIPKNHPLLTHQFPDLLLEAVTQGGQGFDALIVDEAQDFLEHWWIPLLLMLSERASVHVYMDTRQQLWGPANRLPPEITDGASFINLTENVRNTPSIHSLTMNFHPSHGQGYSALVKTDSEPQFVPIQNGKNERKVVQEVVERLINIDGVSPSDIAILTPLSILEGGNSMWVPGKTLLGRYRLVHDMRPRPNEIFCSSIGAAKGLEFPVLILTELYSPAVQEEVDDYSAQLYVGISRARSQIIIVSDQITFEQFYSQL